jgi:hypothetical protein
MYVVFEATICKKIHTTARERSLINGGHYCLQLPLSASCCILYQPKVLAVTTGYHYQHFHAQKGSTSGGNIVYCVMVFKNTK